MNTNLGIIGCGAIAHAHVKALTFLQSSCTTMPILKRIAVASPNAKSREQFAAAQGNIRHGSATLVSWPAGSDEPEYVKEVDFEEFRRDVEIKTKEPHRGDNPALIKSWEPVISWKFTDGDFNTQIKKETKDEKTTYHLVACSYKGKNPQRTLLLKLRNAYKKSYDELQMQINELKLITISEVKQFLENKNFDFDQNDDSYYSAFSFRFFNEEITENGSVHYGLCASPEQTIERLMTHEEVKKWILLLTENRFEGYRFVTKKTEKGNVISLVRFKPLLETNPAKTSQSEDGDYTARKMEVEGIVREAILYSLAGPANSKTFVDKGVLHYTKLVLNDMLYSRTRKKWDYERNESSPELPTHHDADNEDDSGSAANLFDILVSARHSEQGSFINEIRNAIVSLSHPERQYIEGRFYENKSDGDICEILAITRHQLKQIKVSAETKILAYLSRELPHE